MFIYYIYYIIITLLYIFVNGYSYKLFPGTGIKKNKSGSIDKQIIFFIFVSCSFMILILGVRSERNGLDLHNSLGTGYFYYYDYINNDSVLEILRNFGKQKYANFEIGFVLFCKFIGTICSNRQIMLFASALISIVPVGYFIYKNSKNVWLSMVLFMAMPFFGPAYYSAIRRGIAIGFVILSFELIKKRKLIWFIIIIILACTFHSSAIVALAAYPMYYFRLDRESLMVGGLGVLTFVFLLKEPMFLFLHRIIDSNAEIVKSSAVNLFFLLTFLYTICVAFGNFTKDDSMRGLRNIFWLACAAQAFAGINNLAGRVSWYFMPVSIILIPNMFKEMLIKEKTILKPAICLVGVAAIIVGLKFLRTDMVALAYPYVPFWVQKSI